MAKSRTTIHMGYVTIHNKVTAHSETIVGSGCTCVLCARARDVRSKGEEGDTLRRGCKLLSSLSLSSPEPRGPNLRDLLSAFHPQFPITSRWSPGDTRHPLCSFRRPNMYEVNQRVHENPRNVGRASINIHFPLATTGPQCVNSAFISHLSVIN